MMDHTRRIACRHLATIAIVTLGILAASAHSTTIFDEKNYTTFGGADCGSYVAAPKLHAPWLAGNLSGLNRSVAMKGFDPLSELASMNQAILWMTKYCTEHPLSNVEEGAISLFIELTNRAADKKVGKSH